MSKLFRTLWKNKVSTIINLIGLSSAFTIAFLILMYARHEGNYDAFHENSDRIFRMNMMANLDGSPLHLGMNSLPAGPLVTDAYPDIENYLRLVRSPELTVTNEPDIFSENSICYADSSLLTFFDYPIIAGSASDFPNPNTMLVEKEIAIKYFGNVNDAVGKSLKVGNNLISIAGVLDIPAQTHVPFNFFISTSTLPDSFVTPRNSDYLWMTAITYVMLDETSSREVMMEKFSSFYDRVLIPFAEENSLGTLEYDLQPLTDIHVNNGLRFDFPDNVDKSQLTIFTYLAFAILLIASINYMNLFTAQVSKRMAEVGIKKTFGATNRSLIFRFTAETLTIAFIAFLLAILAMNLLFPSFNTLLDLELELVPMLQTSIGWMLLIVVVLGFASGIYPAFHISNLSTLELMVKNDTKRGSRLVSKTLLRKILVTFQLAVSSALMITIFVVSNQLDFIFGKDLGFNKEAVYVVDIPNDQRVSNRLEVIKQRLKSNVNVLAVAGTSAVPGKITGRRTFDVDQQDSPNVIAFNLVNVDSEFLDLLGVDIAEGRNFMKGSEADLTGSFLVNESLVKHVEWEEPLHKRLVADELVGRVAGVVHDFNHASLHNPIEPLVIRFTESTNGFQMIKMNSANLQETVAFIETAWKEFAPEHPFKGFFLDESFNEQYNKEAKLKSMFIYIGVLAVVITCLGLIGMTLFTIERKLKEISIRRVIGASGQHVMVLLSKEYLPVIVIANLIAIPLTIYALQDWLSTFAFQAEINALLYVLVVTLNALLVLMIILPMVINVLRRNLIRALRIE